MREVRKEKKGRKKKVIDGSHWFWGLIIGALLLPILLLILLFRYIQLILKSDVIFVFLE